MCWLGVSSDSLACAAHVAAVVWWASRSWGADRASPTFVGVGKYGQKAGLSLIMQTSSSSFIHGKYLLRRWE